MDKVLLAHSAPHAQHGFNGIEPAKTVGHGDNNRPAMVVALVAARARLGREQGSLRTRLARLGSAGRGRFGAAGTCHRLALCCATRRTAVARLRLTRILPLTLAVVLALAPSAPTVRWAWRTFV